MAGLEQPAAGAPAPQAEAYERSNTASDAPATDSESLEAGAQVLAFAPLGNGEARHTRQGLSGDKPCSSLATAARGGGLAGSSEAGTAGGSTTADGHSDAAADRATEAGAEVPGALDGSRLPRHVAVIMDGNSRWAERRGLPKEMGHEAGVQALKRTVKMAGQWGIPALTVFAFSTENWKRPKAEVVFLMALLERLIADDIAELHRQGVVVRVIGDQSKLPESLQRKIEETRVLTCKNQGLKLTVAVSYSGRQDIVQACRRIAEQVAAGQLDPADITDEMLDSSLETAWLGPELASPDLLIRTSGEHRISNFLLWQAAYTELVFTPALWPDFDREHFVDCLVEFQSRDRRFGGRHGGSQTVTSGNKNQ